MRLNIAYACNINSKQNNMLIFMICRPFRQVCQLFSQTGKLFLDLLCSLRLEAYRGFHCDVVYECGLQAPCCFCFPCGLPKPDHYHSLMIVCENHLQPNLTLQTIATPISGKVTRTVLCFLCQLSDSGIIKQRLGLVFYIRKYELLSCLKIRLKITRERISSRHHIMKEIYHFNMCMLVL